MRARIIYFEIKVTILNDLNKNVWEVYYIGIFISRANTARFTPHKLIVVKFAESLNSQKERKCVNLCRTSGAFDNP